MPSNNGNKLMPVLLKWGLGVVTLIAMGLATMSYNTLLANITELKTKIDTIDSKMDGIVLNDGLQGERISTLKENLKEHEQEGHR